MADKSAIAGFINNPDLDKKNKLVILATKAKLKAEQDKMIKLQAFAGLLLKKKPHVWLLHAKTTFHCYGVRL